MQFMIRSQQVDVLTVVRRETHLLQANNSDGKHQRFIRHPDKYLGKVVCEKVRNR